MNRIAVIVTHHKGGSVWMHNTFRTIGEQLGIRFSLAALFTLLPEAERTPPLILAAPNAKGAEPGLLDREDVRIFHLIRDPRDLWISATNYHPSANEKRLLFPDPAFGGKTYREMLNALPTARDRYGFELRHVTSETIAGLRKWDYGKANSIECRYEALMRDADCQLFSDIAIQLGFSTEELPICGRTFWRNAIFGGKAKARAEGRIKHVRAGEPEQWRNTFDRQLGETFLAQAGDALIKLGYEKDDLWLDTLPEHRAELDLRT